MTDTYYVKVRKHGERRFRFIGSGGCETRLRVHAVMFAGRERAESAVEQLTADNSGYEFRAVRAR